jgi:tryprostatin B 6-hydroxylase
MEQWLYHKRSVHSPSNFTTLLTPEFSAALLEHEAKILKYVDKLDQCIEADAKLEKVTNMRNLLLWFGFDIMGEFVFSKSFGMLEDQAWHHIIVRLQRALSLLGPLTPVPWLIHIAFNLAPRISFLKDWFDTVAWCQLQMNERLAYGSSNQSQDLSYYLMEKDSEDRGLSDSDKRLFAAGDSLLAIVAGR